MIGPTSHRWQRWVVNIFVLALIAVLGYWLQGERNARRNALVQAAVARDAAIARSQVLNDAKLCRGQNKILRVLRDAENENYSHLRRNLHLLRVEATPEVLRIARSDHQARLIRLRRQNCKVHFSPEEVKP